MLDQYLVAIYLGSDSDIAQFEKAFEILEKWQLPYCLHILSAHRTPVELHQAMEKDHQAGVRVFIAGAGMAAHLPGVIASKTIKPVIGVPLVSGPLNGVDALHSIVQMPPGIPVATMAVGKAGAQNAAIFAAQLLGGEWQEKVGQMRQEKAKDIVQKESLAREKGYKAFL